MSRQFKRVQKKFLIGLLLVISSLSISTTLAYVHQTPPYTGSYHGGGAYFGSWYAAAYTSGYLYGYVSTSPTAYGWASANAYVWDEFIFNEGSPWGCFIKLKLSLSFYAKADTMGDYASVTVSVKLYELSDLLIWNVVWSGTAYSKSVVGGSVTVKQIKTIILNPTCPVFYAHAYRIEVQYSTYCTSGWTGASFVQFSSTSTNPSFCYVYYMDMYCAV
ncbi:MAG: hypothetical protein ACFFCH_03605 [Promethearchaeota archaeon]